MVFTVVILTFTKHNGQTGTENAISRRIAVRTQKLAATENPPAKFQVRS
jgi:hypothetical protein